MKVNWIISKSGACDKVKSSMSYVYDGSKASRKIRSVAYGLDGEEVAVVKDQCLGDFIKERLNGMPQDQNIREGFIPFNGEFICVKGVLGVFDGETFLHGLKKEESKDVYVGRRGRPRRINTVNKYIYEVRYIPSNDDKEWFCRVDCNYLKRILREGTLKAKEASVWYFRQVCRARGEKVDDIGAWWRTKVFLRNIGKLLTGAKKEYAYELDKDITIRLIQHLSPNPIALEGELINLVRGYVGLGDVKYSCLQELSNQIFRNSVNQQNIPNDNKAMMQIMMKQMEAMEKNMAMMRQMMSALSSGNTDIQRQSSISRLEGLGMFSRSTSRPKEQYDRRYFEQKHLYGREVKRVKNSPK